MNKKELDLQVMSCGSIDQNWEKKPKRPIISKIIKRDVGDFAIVLTEDVSKPLRFLYLSLLTQKNRLDHIKSIIMKIRRLAQEKTPLMFEDMGPELKQISHTPEQMIKNLKHIQKKLEEQKEDQLIIAKLAEQHATVDPLLILTFRAIAHSPQYKIKEALSCSTPISLVNVYEILRKFGINRDEKNQLNRFVVFLDFKEIDLEFFRGEGIGVEDERDNCEELFDAYLFKYQQEIVLEQMYCELDEY